MIETEVLRKVANAGSIVSVQDNISYVEIVLEEDVSLMITKEDGGGYHIRTKETPTLTAEKKDDDLPVLTVSVTLWPGQDQKDWLKLLDAAVRRAQGAGRWPWEK